MARTLQSLILLAFLSSTTPVFAQIIDDFSDGNFTLDPVWIVDTAEFKVNAAGELQLNAPDAGTSVLLTKGTIPYSAVWEMSVRLEFAPSTSNLLRIALYTESPLLSNTNGYLLEIGENSSTDALRLLRVDGGVTTLLASGTPGLVGTDPVDVRIRITRLSTGIWKGELAVGAGDFQPQFTTTDATYWAGADHYFGVSCLYSATRKDKFFFDNIKIVADTTDHQAPNLSTATVVSAQQIDLEFDEALDSASAVLVSNYTLNNTTLSTATWSPSQPQKVQVQLSAPLGNGQQYSFTVNQVADIAGNIATAQSKDFFYLIPEVADEYDLIINEIMNAPANIGGLPANVEWFELYNRSDKYINLSTLRISDAGGTPKILPDYLLRPDSFVVLCTQLQEAVLAAAAPNVLGVLGFPSLNNDDETLTLSTAGGQVIDFVGFGPSWHTDPNKRDGGWSLERINPTTPCLGRGNWQSCPQLPGGSPGKQNFSWNATPDATPPQIQQVGVVNATTLEIWVSEGVDADVLTDPEAFVFQPALEVLTATPSPIFHAQVLLTLAQPLTSGQLYTVLAQPALVDCSGNIAINTDTLRFGLPEIPAAQDLVINEVLFNPNTGGVDFVEIYNNSTKIISWQDLFLANFQKDPGGSPVALNRLMLPGDYIVFTPEPDTISKRYAQVRSDRILPFVLPTLDDKKGNIAVFWSKNGQKIMIDSFDYFDTYHNGFLSTSDREGVSLERIRPENPTNTSTNWTSAARKGTPTQPNSQQQSPVVPGANDLVAFGSDRLSPDGDGYEDFLDIAYHLPATGYAATMTIFDAGGNIVRRLVRQELIGTVGNLRWDGDTDDGLKAQPGIHILFLEIFAPDGSVSQMKKTFALVQKM